MFFRDTGGNHLPTGRRALGAAGVGLVLMAAACGHESDAHIVPNNEEACTTFVIEYGGPVPSDAADQIIDELGGGSREDLTSTIVEGLDGQPGVIDACLATDGDVVVTFPRLQS